MLVIGIDPGTAITGYGIVREEEDGSLSAIKYGVLRTPSQTPMPERLHALSVQLEQILSNERPEKAAVEILFFQRNVRTAMAVGQSRGVVLNCLAASGVAVSEYTPLEIKQAVTGFGQATKNQVQEMVKILLGLPTVPQPDDTADALAAAICHIHSYRLKELLEKG
jgi:crossover junction endodeoxyribonuclease RuvC